MTTEDDVVILVLTLLVAFAIGFPLGNFMAGGPRR